METCASSVATVSRQGQFIETVGQTGWYFLTVVLDLEFHANVTLCLIYWLFARKNPFTFMAPMSQAILTAFSTASSSATLPITMDTAVRTAGVSKKSVELVLPVGATINMDGTALYEAVAAIFIAQAVGLDLSLSQQGVIAVTATPGRHRRRRNSRSRPRDHGHRVERRRAAGRIHWAHFVGGLAVGPLPHRREHVR